MRSRTLQMPALITMLIAIASTSPVPDSRAASVRSAPEYSVKAAYLLLFTRYVQWPPAAFESPEAPIEILVLGADPFGAVLEETLAGLKSQDRPLAVRRAQDLDDSARPHVVFFAEAVADRQREWLAATLDRPVLTVAEDMSALEGLTVVTFVTETNQGEAKVRFDVNLQSMREARLRINSQMLTAARKIVREAPKDATEAAR